MISFSLFLLYVLVTFICVILFLVYFFMFLIKKATFPKKLFITILSLFLIYRTYELYQQYFFTFDGIKIEHSEEPVVSPNKKKTAQIHYEYYGGAAGGVNALVEVTDEDKNKKMVYYADAQGSVQLKWVDDSIIEITNHYSQYPQDSRDATLNVETDIYHDTGRACKSILLKNTYAACFKRN